MKDLTMINYMLQNHRTYLTEYCKYLAERYNLTNEGKYRIKYNDLYPILYHDLSDEKKVEFFNSFITSMGINPIKINSEKMTLYHI